MANKRDENSRLYGPPRITIIPHEGCKDGPPELHASRVPGQPQKLRIIQPLESWYASTNSAKIAPSSTVYDSQRLQRRWLFNAHPEAFVGSSDASDFLVEGLTQMLSPDATPTDQPLLAISQMADVSNPTRVAPVPVLAMATGESGELLRLSKMDETKWHWGKHEDPTLRLCIIDQHDKEETVLWSNDGAPIQQIKPALSLLRFEPTRWLLVQKKTSTTILQPEYHRVPVSERPPGIDKAIERPSRINPKPILTISSEQTGGIAHSDVSFSYGSQKKPPQLAIIDECGYWTVWDIKGRDMIGSTSKRAKLRHCGHIELGVQDQLPDEDSPAFRAAPHGVLWLGSPGPGVDVWDVPTPEDLDEGISLAASAVRSKKVLLWNRSKFEVTDVKDPAFRKTLPILKSDEPDHILDVKANPVNRSQVFILTTFRLFWIETFSNDAAAVESGGLSILQSFTHLRGSSAGSLRLTVHHGGYGPAKETCMLYLYSEKSTEVDVFWFSVPEKTGLSQYEHHLMRLENPSEGSNGKPPRIQTLCPVAAYLSSQLARDPAGPGVDYLKRQVKFQQLFVLAEDLGLNHTLLAISDYRKLEIVPPDTSREWSREIRRQAHKKRRRQFLQHFEGTFVVPDGLGDMDDMVQRRATRYQELLHKTQEGDDEQAQQRWPRPQNFDLFMSRVAVSIESVIMAAEQPNNDGPLSVFDAIKEATINCLETEGGYIPLHTLHEYEATFEAPPMTDEAVAAWDSRLQQLFYADDQRIVTQPIITQYLPRGNTASPLADIRAQLEEVWGATDLPPRAQHSRAVVIAETAEIIARSMFGLVVLDANLQAADDDEFPTWVPTPPPERIQQLSQRSSLSGRQSISSQRLSMSPTKRARSMSPVKPSSSASAPSSSQPMSPIKPSSSRFSQSPLKPSSAPYSQSSAASSDPASDPNPLQRLSMLAADIGMTELSHPQRVKVLSYWPTERGVPTEGYVSSVAAPMAKHIQATNEKLQRKESRRQKRKSRLFGDGSGSSQTQTTAGPSGTQHDESMGDPADFLADLPTTQPLPRLAPPVIGSSQVIPTAMPSSQPFVSSQVVPQIMSQPMAGRHGMRSPKKKGKRKSGF